MDDSRLRETSSALRVNLEETRREVLIPPRFLGLLDAVDEFVGVRQAAEKMLREYFHPLRNAGVVASQLASLTGGRASYFLRGDGRERSVLLLVDLFVDLLADRLDDDALSRLARGALDFLVDLDGAGVAEGGAELIDAVASCLESHEETLLQLGPTMRAVGRKLGKAGAWSARWREVYRRFSRKVVDGLLRRFSSEDPITDAVSWSCITRDVVVERLLDIRSRYGEETGEETGEELFDLPTVIDVLDEIVRICCTSGSPSERIDSCMRLAMLPEFECRFGEIFRNLDSAMTRLLAEGEGERILEVVDALPAMMLGESSSRKRPLFTTLARLGKGLADPSFRSLREGFIDRLVALGFEAPNIGGVSEDWQVLVNPHHLPCVRTWLAIIRSDPGGYERLLSALVVNLHFRGMFVSDTDLFQRDITELLNSGIGEVFNLVLQLMSFFPVFFNDIGSEGELRDVSTRIDQITGRGDELIHFLRKQCHAEPNNRLVGFSEAVLRYWYSGEASPLSPHLPTDLLSRLPQCEGPWFAGAQRSLRYLAKARGLTIEKLCHGAPRREIEDCLSAFGGASPEEKERVLLLIRLHRLLRVKYGDGSEELDLALSRSSAVDAALVARFREARREHDRWEILREGCQILRALKETITAVATTRATENIYLKRHIAAGIPSMYGSYREEKFDAMGLFIRVMNVLGPHLDNLVDDMEITFATKTTLLDAYRLMRIMLEGLETAGLRLDNLSRKVDLLGRSLQESDFSATQFLNVVEFISEALSDVIQANYISVHERNVRDICRDIATQDAEAGGDVEERADEMAEIFLRSLIASTYGLQSFDRFVGMLRQSLIAMTDHLDEDACRLVLNYSQHKLLSFIHAPMVEHENQLSLGAKGLTLKKLWKLGLPVPEGFILSTELFRTMPVMDYERVRRDTRARLAQALCQIEELSARRLGMGSPPLLVSVRSGASISMPGMMDTIINVGLTRSAAERWAQEPDGGWTAWDCYRRFVQNFAMASGFRDRNRFDELIDAAKKRYGVKHKLGFSVEAMRDIATAYEELARLVGIFIPQDPLEQVVRAIRCVVSSWDSPTARAYRRELSLSDQWGTAVIIQRMIYGNLSEESGSGALFTTDPHSPSSRVELFGDFVCSSQGEDVVSGLVRPLPVSEKQRLRATDPAPISLEVLRPEIFQRLREISRHLVDASGFEHQEMEFTFESPRGEDLHILQSRPMARGRRSLTSVFCGGETLEAARIGNGVGIFGGALSGRVALMDEDIPQLRETHPDEPIILLRPDTVPEDIPLVMAVDGLLTARGGVTSHASVTAKRLEKPCIVNCRGLIVHEDEGVARLGGLVLAAGDLVSIDGTTGNVYGGRHEVRMVRRALRLL